MPELSAGIPLSRVIALDRAIPAGLIEPGSDAAAALDRVLVTVGPTELLSDSRERLELGFAVPEEVVVQLPGIEGIALVLGGPDPAIQAVLEKAPGTFAVGVTGSARLRFPRAWLRPVVREGDAWVDDPARPFAEIHLGAGVVVDQDGNVSVRNATDFTLPPAMVGESGIVVEASGLDFNLSGAGARPPGTAAGWKGVYLGVTRLYLPHLPGARLEVTGLGIDGGGLVGIATATATLDEVPLGVDGLRVRSAMVRLEGLAFPLPSADPVYTLVVEGRLALPVASAEVGVRAVLEPGGFAVAATGQARLGGGIVLHEVAGAQGDPLPVLSASVRFAVPGTGEFALHGGLDVPQEGGAPLRVEVGGHLHLEVAAGSAAITSFSASATLASDWRLPGGLTLHQAGIGIAYDEPAARFSVDVSGRVSLAQGIMVQGSGGAATLAARVELDTVDPHAVAMDGEISGARLVLLDEAEVFDGTLAVALRTRPAPGEPPLRVTLAGGSAGLFRRAGAAVGDPASYYLGVRELAGSFTLVPDGFDLVVGSGSVRLPPEFFSADAGGAEEPAVGVGDDAHPLALRLRAGDGLSFTGAFSFSDFGVRLPSATAGEDVVARLDTATLLFSGNRLPLLTGVAGSLTVPLDAETRAAIGYSDVEWDLAGLPTGEIALLEELVLPLGGDFTLALLPRETEPGARIPGTRLRVTREPGSPHTEFRFDAAVRLAIPESLLADVGGGAVRRVEAESSGWLTFSTDPAAAPAIAISTISVGGDFRLGGADGLKLTGARIDALGLEYLLDRGRDQGHSFVLGLTGMVEFPNGGPRMGLEGARFVFDGDTLSDPPHFLAQGFSFTPGEWISDTIPLMVREASLRFDEVVDDDDEPLPLPQLLDPRNLALGLSLEIAVPMGEKAGLMGRVDGVRAAIDDEGLPDVHIEGLGFGVEDLTLGNTILSGIVYLGGLTGDPRDLYCLGKLGGTMSGTGISGLTGFKLDPPMPLGVCLELSGGSAGIPLGQTGILLTGMSGGYSFANTGGSPCDFRDYLAHPPAAEVAPTVEDQVPSSNPIEAPGCPCMCPPPSMNIFCQPHPDREKYRERAIIKFSSVSEDILRLVSVPLPSGRTVGLADLHGVRFASPAELSGVIGAVVGAVVNDGVVRYWPDLPGELSDEVNAKLEIAQAELAKRLEFAMEKGAQEAGAPPSLWEVIRDEAYRGLPCPDVTMEVSATFSYSGISAFLSVTGGCSVSTTGAAGVVGWLNVVGIPMGRLKGFLTVTSDQGDPDPKICGELTLSIGPLELGKMNAQLDCEGFITGVRDALLTTAAEFGAPMVREVLGVLAPAVERRADDGTMQVQRLLLGRRYEELTTADALALLPELDGGGMSAVVGELLRRAAEDAVDPAERERLEQCALLLLQRVWNQFNPKFVLCGGVKPKLFGMPIGGDVVTATAFVTKHGMGASCAFSPLYLLIGGINAATATLATLLSPLFAGLETAVLGFALELPDLAQMMLDAAGGGVPTQDELESYLDQGMERLLSNATLVAGYRLSPMGMTLVDSSARYLLPDLTDHPASPGSGWVRRSDEERIDLLQQVLATGRLADASWNGRLDDLGMDDRYLGKDFFPHGGLIGAAKIVVPRALLDAPPLDTFAVIFSDEPILTRFQAAAGYVKDYLLSAEEVGTFAFYTPAPNPPTFAVNGRNLSVEELLRSTIDEDYRDRLLTGDYELGPAWSIEESFLLGILEGRLLGVPVVSARMELVPPDGASEGYLEVTGEVPAESWLNRFASASLTFRVRQSPPLPMDVQLRALAAALGLSGGGAGSSAEEAAGAALAAAPRTPEEASAMFGRIRESVEREIEAQLRGQLAASYPAGAMPDASAFDGMMEAERAKVEAALQPLAGRLQALAASVGAATGAEEVLRALLEEVAVSLQRDLPRVALEVSASLTIPDELLRFIPVSGAVSGTLYAYSPQYDPQSTRPGARGNAMRRGGIVAAASLGFRVGSMEISARASGDEVEMEVVPPTFPVEVPRLLAEVEVKDLTLSESPRVRLRRVTLRLDSQPGAGHPIFRLSGAMDPVEMDGFRLEARDGGAIGATLQAFQDGSTELRVDPARLRVAALGEGSLLVHGATRDDPFTFSTAGPWHASLSVEGGMVVRDPAAPGGPPLLEVRDADVTGTIHGEGLGFAELSLRVGAGATLVAFPGQELEQSWTGSATLSLSAATDGRVSVEVDGARAGFPGFLADFLTGHGAWRLFACTPGFDPAAVGDGTLAGVRRDGGVVLAGEVDFLVGAGETRLALRGGAVEIAVQGARLPDLPRLRASVEIGETEIPFASLRLSQARLDLDTTPGRWEPLVRVSGGLSPLRIGAFQLGPRPGSASLRASLEVDREGVATLRIDPARLSIAGAAALHVHGAEPDEPFTLSSDGSIRAGLSLEAAGLALRVPLAPNPPLLELNVPAGANVSASLRGKLGFAEVELAMSGDSSITAFPGAEFVQGWMGSAGAGLLVNSDGRFALVLRGVAGFELPPPLSSVATLAGGTETRLVAYSPGYDPSAGGDTPMERVRREGGMALRTTLHLEVGPPGSTFHVQESDAEFAVLAPSGEATLGGVLPDEPRLVGRFDLRTTLPADPWLGLRLRSGTFDTHPDGDEPFLMLAAEMPAIRMDAFSLAPGSGGTLRPRLELHAGGELRLVLEPALLRHRLLGSHTRLLLHGAGGASEPLVLTSTGGWDAGVTVDGDVWVESPYDPDDPPLLHIGLTGVGASMSGEWLRPTTLRVNVPASTAPRAPTVTVFPESDLAQEIEHGAFDVEAHADGTFLARISLPRFDFGALVVHGDDPGRGGDEPEEPLTLTVSHYGFAIENARFRLEPLSEPSLRLRRFVVDGNGDFQATAVTRGLEITDYFYVSSSAVHVERAAGVAKVRLVAPRLGLRLPWAPRLTPIAAVNRRLRLLPAGPDVEIEANGVFTCSHPAIRVNLESVARFDGNLEVGTRIGSPSGVPMPFVELTQVSLAVMLPGWTASAAGLVRLHPSGFEVELDDGSLKIPGLFEVSGGARLAVEMGSGPTIARATLALEDATVTLFGSLDCGEHDFEVTTDAEGSFELGFTIPATTLIPGVLEIPAGSCAVSRTRDQARVECSVSILGLVSLDLWFSATPNGLNVSFAPVLYSLDTGAPVFRALDLFGIGELLDVELLPNSLLLRRDAAGRFFVAEAHLRASFLGQAATFRPSVEADGGVTLPWVDALPVDLGPFRLVSDDTAISFDFLHPASPDLTLRLFGAEARVEALPGGGHLLTCSTTDWITLLAGVVEIGPATWTLAITPDASTVGFEGEARMLRCADGAWQIVGTTTFSVAAPSGMLTASVSTGNDLSLSALSDQLGISAPSGAFRFQRATNGDVSASVDLAVTIFGEELSASAAITGGKATAEWQLPALPMGPVMVRSTAKSKLEVPVAPPSAADCRLTLAGGEVVFPSDWGVADMKYEGFTLSGEALSAEISRGAEATEWRRVPGVSAMEYQLRGPTVKVVLDGPSATVRLEAGPLEVRTVAKKDDGSAYFGAETGTVSVEVGAGGSVSLPFPSLPNARQDCIDGVNAQNPRIEPAYSIAMEGCKLIPPTPDISQATASDLSDLLGAWAN